MEARHYPDRTRTNNQLRNLRWGTHTENMEDKITQRMYRGGETHHLAKFTDAELEGFRSAYKMKKYTITELAAKAGMSQSHMSRIINYKARA